MKALILNGSPRQGNSVTALKALKKGLGHIDGIEITDINATNVDISPCIACGNCLSGGKCIHSDDTNEIVDKAVEADIIVFATPVYWWGITAQMKLIIDKFYSQMDNLHRAKKIGIIVIGEAAQNDPQYTIIPKQFECICDYLGWDIKFCKTYTAGDPGDLAEDPDAIAELESLWKKVK